MVVFEYVRGRFEYVVVLNTWSFKRARAFQNFAGSRPTNATRAFSSTVGDTEKFRIPFRRTAVARLKNRGKNGTPFVKNGRSVRPRYRFNLSRSPYVSLKEI